MSTTNALFRKALQSAEKAYQQPTADKSTQELISSSLTDLSALSNRISDLGLFSPNESLDDISTKDMVYLVVPYLISQVQGRLRTTEPEQRLKVLAQSQRYLKSFIQSLDEYGIVPEEERVLSQTPTPTAAMQRRELKIKQFKKEKELKARIEALHKRRRTVATPESGTEFGYILSLLPASEASAVNEEDDDEIDDILRQSTLVILRLYYAQAHSQLENMEQEIQLLRSAPPPVPSNEQPEDERQHRRQAEDLWKLDQPLPSKDGPLLDPSGRPLRPFTILPSNAAERARLQAQVFGPGYTLPTMSVDEYLEIERQRGKFVSGGGPASAAAPTSSEQLTMDAEMDGSLQGELKSEEKRLKDERWAQFTDANPRGAGNTMNRG